MGLLARSTNRPLRRSVLKIDSMILTQGTRTWRILRSGGEFPGVNHVASMGPCDTAYDKFPVLHRLAILSIILALRRSWVQFPGGSSDRQSVGQPRHSTSAVDKRDNCKQVGKDLYTRLQSLTAILSHAKSNNCTARQPFVHRSEFN